MKYRQICAISLFACVLCACQDSSSITPPVAVSKNNENAWTPSHDWAKTYPGWAAPTEPFNIIENIYYVGTKGLSSFLITSDAGHVVIDGGLPQNAPLIAANIDRLGFKISDVKILLNSHAHFDHSGGLAELKRLSGAGFIASEGDRSALEGGFYLGAEDKPEYSAPPVFVDRVVADKETITLGPITLTANITPGHTRGCTSWTMRVPGAEGDLDVLFFCSATVAGNRLVPPQYEGIAEDYRRTFKITRNWRPDIFLSNHPSFFAMTAKREKQLSGDSLAFVERKGFPKMMMRLEADFEKKLAAAKETASQNNDATAPH